MADIELVIKIPKGLKNDFESEQWTALSCMEMKNALKKATPLPKGHGDLKDVKDILNKINLNYNNHQLIDAESLKDIIVTTSTIIEADNEVEK